MEFAEIGVYTQAMQVAQEMIDNESPNSRNKKTTRSKARAKQAERSPEKPKRKLRKRIIVLSDDEDD